MKISNCLKSLAAVAVAAVALAHPETAKAVSFNYSSEPGATIRFPGDTTFSFTPGTVSGTNPTGANFQVTSGSASGSLGNITGNFNIGAITTSGATQSAPVSGTGMFTIMGPGGFNLTANLVWIDITQTGASGTLNIVGTVNLTNIMYAGANPDLVALRDAGQAANVLTFQFVPPVTLQQLRNGPGPNSTSFSGTVASIVPEGGATVALLGLALTGIALLRRKLAADL
jgi:hypothetical protein